MTTSPARFWVSSMGGAAVVGLAAGGVLWAQSGGAGPGSPAVLPGSGGAAAASGSPVRASGNTDGAGPSVAAAGVYRDGQYSQDGAYLTPGGDESIGVTLVVARGLVTDAVVRTEASSPTARQFQVQFQSGIAAAVVGRDLAGLAVTRVAGASLTSVGFNDALARIRFDAER